MDKEKSFYNGKFLISEADLQDPNFYRTVVLMIEHNNEGAFGLVVNQKSTAALEDVAPDFKGSEVAALPVFIGGPVQQDHMFILHSGLPGNNRSAYSIEPVGGIIFEPDFRIISDFIQGEMLDLDAADRPILHFYAGYSGWGPGQLEGEIDRHSWILLDGSPELVFSENPEEAWSDALRKKGGIYWVIGETGFKPSNN